MPDIPIFFPWSLLNFLPLPQPTYFQDESEKLRRLEQHFELLGMDYAKKLSAALAAPLSG